MDSPHYHRRSIRLKDFDYSQAGAYFITICAHDRECLFGDIVNGWMELNDAGRIVEEQWRRGVFDRNVELGASVVMPNHLHGIVVILEGTAAEDHGGAAEDRHGTARRETSTMLCPYGAPFWRNDAWLIVRDRPHVQIGHHETNQRLAPNARLSRLATRLLRTRHP